jgi:hypothetical protein
MSDQRDLRRASRRSSRFGNARRRPRAWPPRHPRPAEPRLRPWAIAVRFISAKNAATLHFRRSLAIMPQMGVIEVTEEKVATDRTQRARPEVHRRSWALSGGAGRDGPNPTHTRPEVHRVSWPPRRCGSRPTEPSTCAVVRDWGRSKLFVDARFEPSRLSVCFVSLVKPPLLL